ncbi:PAS domain S-box protein [Methanosarcina sp. DH2]|uniref:PAS domain S-box protein n=1 Tax=Methanosarcina sp. DH2 TaxID=2605639 RepID=UPI001E65A338|nr:PAS domain S-box protein [Methanosarcina sp. DH2]MCC4771600.1 PAS domain S-box protein [Methanosarcina sp. DH2]
MENEIRDSGIDVIGNVPWGTHLCQFYQTKEDLKHILIPYLKTGLENNEFCIWITSKPLDKEEAKAALKKTVPDIDVYLEKGQIEIIPHADWHTKEGVFDSKKALNNLTEKASQSLASGYDGLRFIENICWLDNKSWNDFVNYEERLDSATGMYPVIALCTYSLEICSVTDIIDIVTNHQFILSRKNGKWEKTENTGMKITAECTQVEQTLRETELQYKSLYENSLDGILLTKPDGTILSANPQACYLFGMTENEIIQAGREGLVVKDEKLAAALEERELNGRMNAELTCRRKDGSTFVCNVTSNLFADTDDIIKTSMIVRDITERKQAEEELRQAYEQIQKQSRELQVFHEELQAQHEILHEVNKALRESEARLQVIVANSPDIIFEQDRDLRYTWIYNPLYPLSASDVIGKTEADLLPPDQAQQLESIKHRVLYTGKHEHVLLQLSPGGEPRWFEAIYEPRYDAAGQITGVLSYTRDVTERKKIEKELQESEVKYRNIVETASEGIWIGDPEARTIYVNKRLTEMLGYTPDEMIGKFAWDFASEEEKQVVKKNIERRWQGIDESYEFKFIRKDGSPLWAIVSSKSLFDDDGKFTGSMSMLTDITRRKKAEDKLKETLDSLEEKVRERTAELEGAYNSLKESKKGLEDAQKMAHIGNWEWDIVNDKSCWSDETYRILGLSPKELKPAYDVFLSYIQPDDRDYVDNAVKQALNGKPFNIDFKIISADGTERIVNEQGEVVFDEKNNPVRMRGTVQDITESKLAQQKIQESEERYRSFIENFKGIAFQADENFIPVFMHGTVEEITGYNEEDFMSRQPWKDIIHSEDLPRIYEEEEKVRNSPYRAYGEIDFRIIHRDGKIKWVHEIYQKIPGNNKTPDKYQGAIYDITERKEAEETLAKLEKIRIKEIHHRIKNNLQVISSLLDLQAETFSRLEVCKTPEVVKAFMESQSRVVSMALIHEELYRGDKIDTLDFAAYLRKLTTELFRSYNLGNKNFSFKLDLEQVYLGMDTAIPLGIIVNELVSNSFKYAFPARSRGEIYINLRRTEASAFKNGISCQNRDYIEKKGFHYTLEVSDNGKGIPEGIDIENSTSLGLQLVNILVEQIDGCIKLERDQGTKFTIWFSDIEV